MPIAERRTARHILAALLLAVVTGWAPTPASAAGVVGGGTPASCTSAALEAAVVGGGAVTFNCGPDPVTIVVAQTLQISAASTTIDGGGLVTLSGGGQRRIIRHRSLGSVSALTLRNLRFTGGLAAGAGTAANGAAIQSIFQGSSPAFIPVLTVENVAFEGNISSQVGAPNAGDFGGGAIFSQGGSVSVIGSSFTSNRADNGAGGAIHILQSALALSGSSFTENSAIGDGQGGAIYIDGLGGPSGVFSVADSGFVRNRSHNAGGAIYVNMYEDSTRTTIERSSFVENALVGGDGALGGAISGGGTNIGAGTGNPRIEIRDSTFAGNSARRTAAPFDGSGGALAFAQRAVITITNSTFSANRAEGSSFNANGGALYVVNNTTPFEIISSTFANNHAGWVGGAITAGQIGGGPGGAVRNVIFSHNSADNGGNDWEIGQHCSAELTDGGNNLQYPPRNTNPNTFNEVSCLQGKSAIGQRGLPDFRDPRLTELLDTGGPTQTIPIAYDSPARDGGNPATCPAADQRGRARSGACDIGAHEFSDTPYISAIAPPFAELGRAALPLSVRGADFQPGDLVRAFDPPATQVFSASATFVDSSELHVTLDATLFASLRTLSVRVHSTAGQDSNARELAVIASVSEVFLPLVTSGQ